jgi:hypothetical protein
MLSIIPAQPDETGIFIPRTAKSPDFAPKPDSIIDIIPPLFTLWEPT